MMNFEPTAEYPRNGYFPSYREAMACPDPIVDEVALQRALEGDERVLDALTARERDALLDRLAAYWGTDRWQHIHIFVHGHKGGFYEAPPMKVVEPLWRAATNWKMSYAYLRYRVEGKLRREQRRRAAA